jgi:hypothetical protein
MTILPWFELMLHLASDQPVPEDEPARPPSDKPDQFSRSAREAHAPRHDPQQA